MKSLKDINRPSKWGISLAIAGLISWIIPLVGLPVSVIGIIINARSSDSKKVIWIILCVVSLVATTVNATVGSIQVYNMGKNIKDSINNQAVRQSSADESRDVWGYPISFEGEFMNGCMSQGAGASKCSCAYRLVEEEYAYPEALQYENTSYPSDFTQKLMSSC